MKKLGFWKSDWFLGLVVALVLLVASNGDLIQSLERKAYDLGVKASSRAPSDQIAVIAIDDPSIANIGRWPWPRDVHARMTDILAEAKAKVIANSVFFFEPQIDPGLAYINKLLDLYNQSLSQPVEGAAASPPGQFTAMLQEAEQALNTDRKLADSFKRAGNVLLPMVFQSLAEPQGNPDKPLPDYVSANSLPADMRGAEFLPPPGIRPLYPIAELGAHVIGIGHLNAASDVDGAVRTEPL
ncbi:MAG: CHASE2 domain-containing protein, partial [Burkholderiales bacterium]|nr:CHASE2 domain-containing protein [Burkholderiales bacterium]